MTCCVLTRWTSRGGAIKSALALSLLLLVSWVGTGCTEQSSPGDASGGGGEKRVVGVTMQNLTNPFFTVIADHLKAELEGHGYEIQLFSAEGDVARQQSQIQDFIVNGAAAIVLNPRDSKAIGPAIVEANKKGIPVFTVDIACLDPTAKVTAHIGTDNLQGGKLAGEAMIEALGGKNGKVAILDFNMVESCILRVQGFKEVIEAHNKSGKPGKIEICGEWNSGGSKAVGFASTQDLLQPHGDVAAIFAINDPSALGARAALEQAGKADQVKLIGFDGQPEGKEAIRDGKIYADPIQFPDQMGVRVGKAILTYFSGEPVDPVQLIPTSLYRQADAKADPEIQ